MKIKHEKSADVWIELARAEAKILRTIESDLKAQNMPTLSCYDVLLEVERAGPHGLRPLELETRLLLPQYGVSRMVDRIIKAGLIKSAPYIQDGRGKSLIITSLGKKTRREMWRIYGPALDTAIMGKLDVDEANTLKDLLVKINT